MLARVRIGAVLRPPVLLAFVNGTGLLQHMDRPAAQGTHRPWFYLRHQHRTAPAETNQREVRAGSIEADLISSAVQGLSAVVNVIGQIQIVEKFVKTYGTVLEKYLGGSKETEATRSDLKDVMGAMSAIANDPNGRSTLQAVAYEDGKRKIKAVLVFDTSQAREAQKQIEDQKLPLESSTSADHQRVLMTFKQSNVKARVIGKRTGERVAIEDISPCDLALIYASELAEQRIKHEVREADENVYKKTSLLM